MLAVFCNCELGSNSGEVVCGWTVFLELCRDQVTDTVGLAHSGYGLLIEISVPLCVDPLPANRASILKDQQGLTCSCPIMCGDMLQSLGVLPILALSKAGGVNLATTSLQWGACQKHCCAESTVCVQ